MKKLLDIKNLKVTFQTQGHEFRAVRGIDFSLSESETLGIVGESGCGKSALAKALIKLHPARTACISGEIRYKGEDLIPLSEVAMNRIRGKEIGMIFQDAATSFNPTLKMGVQLLEGFHKHFPNYSMKESTEVVCELLRKAGLPHPEKILASYPFMLSGGMRQRAMIALTLAFKPQILVADEPTTAIDALIQARILELLKQQQAATKMGIIMITHDMRLVAQFCDRVMVMYGGMIVESAPIDRLFQNPQHPYTKGLLKAIPPLDHDQGDPLTSIEGSPPHLATLKSTYCSFCSRCPERMNICAMASPSLFQVNDLHLSACFKNDPRCKQ
jgi:oligopeptide transport system ATP-binding protein